MDLIFASAATWTSKRSMTNIALQYLPFGAVRQPKIPVQEYPEVTRPMARIRIDPTGELPVMNGNGGRLSW